MTSANENAAPPFRFPAVSERTADAPLALPPFAGFPDGWSGTLEEFLSALRRRDMALEEAPLAAVVDQYLTQRERFGLDEAGEFLHVAASLIDWKARLLLPRDPILAEPDPREEIVRALEASAHRKRIRELSEDEKGALAGAPAGLSLLDLMVLLNEVEQRALGGGAHAIPLPEITVADQLRWLAAHLASLPREPQPTEPWFALQPSLPAKICLFLALLELSKRGSLRLEQQHLFGPMTAVPL